MNILGFNPSHHSSVCLLQDGELKYFIQEERVGNRIKYASPPWRTFLKLVENYKIDYIAWASPSIKYEVSSHTKDSFWLSLAYSFFNKTCAADFSETDHHITHAFHSFYNSGFTKSLSIVVDGMGSRKLDKDGNFIGRETESIFVCQYPDVYNIIYQNIIPTPELINLSRAYETITMYLGWGRDEAGKTMGLSPYGTYNPKLPDFFKGNLANPDVFYYYHDEGSRDYIPSYYKNGNPQTYINSKLNPILELSKIPEEWHHNKSKITNLEKDLAWKIQKDTQQLVGDYIEKAIKETGLKQICCSGGYFLNCVANYYLQKRFPDVEFYFEPIANDAGTAIGAAKLLWHGKTKDATIRPFKSLYLGKQYSKKKLLKGIKKYT